ncbi:hypothetical protein AS855_01250 [Brucella intermedia M86]|nr:hypothetical protein AS855_01250 [Brucella intermedia M86]
MLCSPYIYIAIAITILCFPLWTATGSDGLRWPSLALGVIPSMLGFSMGGMAIALAFSSSDAFDALAEDGAKNSTFLTVIGNFFHFILIQTVAILIAMITITYPFWLMSAVGIFFLVYAVLTGIALSGQLLMTAKVFNAVAAVRARKRSKED